MDPKFKSPIATAIRSDNDYLLELELREMLREVGLNPRLFIQLKKGKILIESEPSNFDLTFRVVTSKHPEFMYGSYQDNIIAFLVRSNCNN